MRILSSGTYIYEIINTPFVFAGYLETYFVLKAVL